MAVPLNWHDSNNVLTAPNGIRITDGFRTYVLTHNWDAGNIPLEAAHGLSPLELSNPGLGNGTRQSFRWIVLEWTSKGGVFEAYAGQELVAALNLLHSVQNTLASVINEKNGLIGENNKLVGENNDLQKKIAALEAQPIGTAAQQQEIDQLTAQVNGFIAKLTQINSLSKV